MAVIIDKFIDTETLKTLDSLKINYYKSASIDSLYTPVNTHPDMQIHFINDTTAVCAPCVYTHYKNTLPCHIDLIKGNADPCDTYPGDCAYNIAILGKRLIGNLEYVDDALKTIYSNLGYEFINVKQGYSKCNLCIIDANSAITEDEGLYKILTKHGIDVLKIKNGEISLKNFPYGFIGGTSGFIKEKTLGFCGNLSIHSEYDSIKSFITSKGISIIHLSQTQLGDFGSLLYFNDIPV